MAPDLYGFSAALSACAAGAQWPEALLWLAAVGHMALQSNGVMVSAAVTACESAGRWAHALATFAQRLGQGPKSLRARSLRPDLVLVNSAIAAAPWSGALHLLKAQQEWRMTLNMASFVDPRAVFGLSEVVG